MPAMRINAIMDIAIQQNLVMNVSAKMVIKENIVKVNEISNLKRTQIHIITKIIKNIYILTLNYIYSIEIDFCYGSICQHGYCDPTKDGYKCICKDGYIGKYCERMYMDFI